MNKEPLLIEGLRRIVSRSIFTGDSLDEALSNAGVSHAGVHAVKDQVAFKFRERTDDDVHGRTERLIGVEVAAKPYALKMSVTSLCNES